MISSLKQPVVSFNGSDVFWPQPAAVPSQWFSVLPPCPAHNTRRSSSVVSLSKPLFVSKIESFAPLGTSKISSLSDNDDLEQKRDLVVCKAYEVDKSTPIDGSQARSETARKLKIGVYFATWWALNVIFNIYNKKVLNAYPCPWLTSTFSLAAGSLIMLISWTFKDC